MCASLDYTLAKLLSVTIPQTLLKVNPIGLADNTVILVFACSVKMADAPIVKAGDSIKMTLMKRTRNSTYAQPVFHWTTDRTHPHNMSDTNADLSYCKLLTAGPDEIMQIIAEEKKQLLIQLNEEAQGVSAGMGW